MNCYLHTQTGNKAKKDIDSLSEGRGFRNVAIYSPSESSVTLFFCKLLTQLSALSRLKKGDVLLVQYPYKKFYEKLCKIAHLKGAKVVTLIHDLGSFRRARLTPTQEVKRLSNSDVLIVHNEAMKCWLEEKGYGKPMVTLNVFDYVSESTPEDYEVDDSLRHRIIYAGSLGLRKNKFLYELTPAVCGNLEWHVYGKGLDKEMLPPDSSLVYEGFMPSDKFVATVKGGWSVVWDGDSIKGCTGNWGDYLRYNNPHKASFYLRAGLPLVLWSKAAMAPYLLEHGLGIAVDSLDQLPEAIAAITPEEYARMKSNVMKIKDKLQRGGFFDDAFEKALKLL